MATTQGGKGYHNLRMNDTLRKGISNSPPPIQPTPQATFESLNLEKYEVFSTEPLHDLKGHIHIIIEESTKKAAGETKQILKNVQATVLSKKTLHCSDYHKAVINIYKSLQQCINPDTQMLELFCTATEICEIMYAPDSRRTPTAILKLHNLTYQHGTICFIHRSEHQTCNVQSFFSLHCVPFTSTTANC